MRGDRYIPKAFRVRVAVVARHRCGYCLTQERIVGAPMEIAHIIPEALGGLTEEDNLWLACSLCNDHKGDKIAALDARTRSLTRSYSSVILKHMLNQPASLDLLFHALADPTRRAMVERLSRAPASVSQLAQPLTMSLPAVVQHLQVLESSGLVHSEKVGRVRTYRIEPKALSVAEQWISERRTSWEHRLDRLGDYLAEHRDEPDQKE